MSTKAFTKTILPKPFYQNALPKHLEGYFLNQKLVDFN